MAKVPSVPTAALDAIQDRNVYEVLRAITDMMNVRNGQTGDSDSAFVTRADLANLRAGGRIIGVGGGSQQSQGLTPPVIAPSDIARVINDLQAQVIESPLFKALGERIDRIDSPGSGVFAQIADEQKIRMDFDTSLASAIHTVQAGVDSANAAIQSEANTRATAVSALSQQMTTVQAEVGSNTAAIQQEAQARADADGNLSAKWSVKTDVNGYVSGFGLLSEANNAAPRSDFIVRADRFSIGSPSGPGIAPRVPFIVLTTPQYVNGYYVPPGVYIDAASIAVASIGEAHIQFAAIRRAHIQTAAIGSAQIEDASITNAKIGTAEIDTLKIRGDAVTVPRGSVNAAGSTPIPDTTVCLISMPNGIPAVIVQATAVVTSSQQGRAYLVRNGVVVSDYYFGSPTSGSTVTPVLAYYDTSQVAANYAFVIGPSGGGGPVTWNGAVLTGTGFKR